MKKRLHVNDYTFVPTSENGVYARTDDESAIENMPVESDKFIDVQIILTEDEFNAFANRKIKIREDRKHEYNDLAAMSPIVSVPYVSSKRMLKDHYRGGDTASRGRFAFT